jgi:predicted CopG family antitoxin
MSRTVNIDDEVYARLEDQAKDRGVTVAEIIDRLSQDAKDEGIALALERMRAKGLLAAKEVLSAQPEFKPVEFQGEPLSEMIIRERR